MSPKGKAGKAQAEMLGLEEIDKDDLMVCGACGSVFDVDIAETCPHCKGLGNPQREAGVDAENPDGVVTCGSCGAVFNKKVKGVDEEGFFGFGEAGLFCPACKEQVEDKDGKTVAKDEGW